MLPALLPPGTSLAPAASLLMMEKQKSLLLVLGPFAALVFVAAAVAFACSSETGPPSQSSVPETPVSNETGLASSAALPPLGALTTQSPTPSETPPTVPAQAVPVVPVPPGPASGPSPNGSAATPPAGQSVTVTLADEGMTVRLRVGDRFLLNLGDPYIWNVSIADPAIVSRVVNIAVVRGAQGVYEGRAAGETRLEAVGDLPCRQSRPPCLAPSRLFRLTIVVS